MSRSRLLLGLAVVAAALIGAPTAAAAGKPKPKPKPPKKEADLVVSKITVDGLPSSPYVVVEPDGTVKDFKITVVTTNRGDAASEPSTTDVKIERPAKAFGFVKIPVRGLRAHRSDPETVTVTGLDFKLGHFFVRAQANRLFAAPESDHGNNELTSPEIPVIARQWKVDAWTTHVISTFGGQDSTDVAQPGMIFHFSRYDAAGQRFLYSVIGSATETVKVTNPECTVTGNASALHNPWNVPESSLSLSYALTSYEGVLDGSSEPTFLISAACQQGEATFEAHWNDLTTAVASSPRHSMADTARSLGDGGTFGSILQVTNAWLFHADVP